MEHPKTWNALEEWKHTDIDWVRVDISKEDLKRFTERSDIKGLIHTIGFLLIIASTGTFAYWSFSHQRWILMAVALYLHGMIYAHFANALHELSHNTVFKSRWLSNLFTTIYGLLYWVWNPYLYQASHQNYHHRYTLHQGSDGEDVPNYVELTPALLFQMFLGVFQFKALIHNVGRLFTLKPTSKHWRGRGYRLDTWEQFVLNTASEKQRRNIRNFAVLALVSQVFFVGLCIYFKLYFLPVLITLAPFYGCTFHIFMCGIHQHATREANHPDFRISCGDAILDPFSSFVYWHMEYHTEHHMFAAIPCYNLKKFSEFIADQMPPKEHALPRLLKLHKISREKYGNWQNWRDNFGRYKGF